MSEATTATCPSCGAAVDAAFCARCGERRVAHEELTLRAQMAQFFGGMFNVDGRFLRSFRLLLTRPGFLAAEYCRGARVGYMRPVQLFLVCNLIYFLLQGYTGFNTFNSTLELQLERQIYGESLRPFVEAHVARTGETIEAYSVRFNGTSSTLARTLLVLLIPAFTALLALLCRRPRRTFVEHLVLATHFVAFELAFVYVPVLWAMNWIAQRGWLPGSDFEQGLIPVTINFVWWTLALRRFYGIGLPSAGARALLLSTALMPIVLGYRYLLFWITFWIT